jgi:leucyl-tRNA synthetase
MGGSYRFLQRIWNLVQEHTMAEKTDAASEAMDRAVHRTVKKVSDDLADMGFNTAIAALMELTNELYKLKADVPMGAEAWQRTLSVVVQLLAPFAPHIADELWQQLGQSGSVHTSDWPTYDEKLLVQDRITYAVQVNGKLRSTITVATGSDEALVTEQAQIDEKVVANLADRQIIKTIFVPGKLVNFVVRA